MEKTFTIEMGIVNNLINRFITKPKVEAFGNWKQLNSWSWSFDGEKNLGEAGTIKDYYPDYNGLRLRAWQSYLESEVTQIIIKKYGLWIIGSGLKLQSEPNEEILKPNKINLNREPFAKSVEAQFMQFCKSKRADYSNLKSLNTIAATAHKNAIVGGDVLVVMRYIKKEVKIQLIDGCHVQTPYHEGYKLKNGNVINHGIEFNKQGEHVAYWVHTSAFNYVRIKAKNTSGLTAAFMVFGSEYRLDNKRGIPIISGIIESLKKMERYKEATLGSAEERQKIAYFIEHMLGSTGENPLQQSIAKAFNYTASQDDSLPKDINYKELNNTIAATVNKQAINMPINSTLKSLESKNELYFKDFYGVNIELIAASIPMPKEVAMSIYDSNFSASRAALKDWEHILLVNRSGFAEQFYQPIYDFWLSIKVLENKINAPGYLKALQNQDYEILEAYRNARFIGQGVPHIDPLKEVEAERKKLGSAGDHLPLTTAERSTELLNGGEYKSNLEKFKLEVNDAKDVEPEQKNTISE